MQQNEKRDLKIKSKRLLWFILGIFIFDAFICFLLFKYTKINEVLAGFIVIVFTALLYLLFLFLCDKIDKKKKEKLENSGKKDPFSHE